ncbi:16882_t:CDS:2, partial [Gigaspora rosea]
MTESEKTKKGRKKGKTQDTRSKNGNMENESQVPISELENTGLKENQKGDSLCQSNSTEKSFFSSNGRSEDLMVDQIEGSGSNPDNVMSDVGS